MKIVKAKARFKSGNPFKDLALCNIYNDNNKKIGYFEYFYFKKKYEANELLMFAQEECFDLPEYIGFLNKNGGVKKGDLYLSYIAIKIANRNEGFGKQALAYIKEMKHKRILLEFSLVEIYKLESFYDKQFKNYNSIKENRYRIYMKKDLVE